MVDYIVKLEGALITAGIEYELKYLPSDDVYVLRIDDTEAFIMSVKEETSSDSSTDESSGL